MYPYKSTQGLISSSEMVLRRLLRGKRYNTRCFLSSKTYIIPLNQPMNSFMVSKNQGINATGTVREFRAGMSPNDGSISIDIYKQLKEYHGTKGCRLSWESGLPHIVRGKNYNTGCDIISTTHSSIFKERGNVFILDRSHST